MLSTAQSVSDARHCPACEYDLRGNTSGRCPECGTPIASTSASRIPWIFREARGGIRAYVQTIALLIFRPSRLTDEMNRRVPPVPAVRFHQESMALATIMGTGFLTLCFLLHGSRLDEYFNPSSSAIISSVADGHPLLGLPLYVWTDQLLVIFPLLPAVYLSLNASAWSYRMVFAWSDRAASTPHRRGQRIALYASGLAPVLVTLIGLFFVTWLLTDEDWTWALARWRIVLYTLMACFGVALVAAAYRPTFALLAGAGHRRIFINMLLSILFLVSQIIIWATIFTTVFWVCGYILIAAWAISR